MNYFNPVKLVFGSLVRRKITEECVGKSVLIICSSTAYNRYSKDPELSALFSFSSVTFEHGFESNPSLTDISEISNKYRDSSLDLIVGLGGGSAMDVAKIASVSIPAIKKGIHIDDLLKDSTLFSRFKEIDCIQVPTTAGTGSEVTPFATVWDYESQQKKSLSHPVMYAKKAFIDPDFLSQVPLEVAISTGLDALNQAFESIWNKSATSMSLLYAMRAARLSLETLPSLNDLDVNADVRARLAEASLCAGVAISQTRTSICHSISYPLTLKFDIPHGLACAFSMLSVYDFNKEYINEQLKALAINLNCDPRSVIEGIFDQYKLSDLLGKYIVSSSQVFDSVGDMLTKGRFENNIKACSTDQLKSVLINSCHNIGLD
jgi:alcohol dehydrogenase class IV